MTGNLKYYLATKRKTKIRARETKIAGDFGP